ncbi:MAG: Histidine kinase [Bogoriella megaspora]|nr:MAG: Histidine kinase [Bogoriella megaspora]
MGDGQDGQDFDKGAAINLDPRLSQRLSIVASLKAAQLTSSLQQMSSQVRGASSRVLIQNALQEYNNGNAAAANAPEIPNDLKAGLQGGQQTALLLQAVIFPNTTVGNAKFAPLFNVTGDGVTGVIQLPYNHANGTPAFLGDSVVGYPYNLYPNITFQSVSGSSQEAAFYNGQILNRTTTLLLGPYMINSTFALVSITVPIVNNNTTLDIIGWLTAVIDARLILQVVDSPVGLDETGIAYLIGPDNTTNHFGPNVLWNTGPGASSASTNVRFVIPINATDGQRHPDHAYGTPNQPFGTSNFPAMESALSVNQNGVNNAGSTLRAKNEAGQKVSVGYAMPQSRLIDWVVVVEQLRGEVWAPINHLRNILLACIFATVGGLLIFAWPIAHFSSKPIARLRRATARSIVPPGYSETGRSTDGFEDRDTVDGVVGTIEGGDKTTFALAKKEGLFSRLAKWRDSIPGVDPSEGSSEKRRRIFRIPGKVKTRKHFIHDELTDLTTTFNEMSDELMMQYERLEERVKQRTAELELSKKAAEAANESKTLFIANISHELKTPLNGILGMCAVCMSEEDPVRLKRSLGIIYKSGDLLLNLLTDLLTFSKNQVGQQIALDEKEFRLRDISAQVLAIFDKQAKEGEIDFRIDFQSATEVTLDDAESGPVRPSAQQQQFGRVKDMVLYGDQHRILQVVINLVSNSLKFTPKGGSVTLSIRCLGALDGDVGHTTSRTASVGSRISKLSKRSVQFLPRQSGPQRRSQTAESITRPGYTATANEINAADKRDSRSHFGSERSPSPPPGRSLLFEFEVKDTGPGIAPHQQAHIFEPFVQGDLGLSKKYGGTGLGLSICSQLASLMRGKVNLESQLGEGSTFTMCIPLRHLTTRHDSTASSSIDVSLSRRSSVKVEETMTLKTPPIERSAMGSSHSETNTGPVAFEGDSQPRLVGLSQPFFASTQPLESPGSQQAAAERLAAEASRTGDKVKVLVAEDNKVNQEVVLRMLKLEDIYDVTVAADGQEALDLVKATLSPDSGAKPYNLIFMDVQMPNLDGLESTRLIRQEGFKAPIVALTAFSEESNVRECMASGMDHFLAKPIKRPALKKVLKAYCYPIEEGEEPPDALEKGKKGVGEKEGKEGEKMVNKKIEAVNGLVDGPMSSSTMVLTSEEPVPERKTEDSPAISPLTSPLS